MQVLPHITTHNADNKNFPNMRSAGLKSVKAGGLDVSEVDPQTLAVGLIQFATTEKVDINPYRMMFADRDEMTLIPAKEATKLLQAAIKAGEPVTIDDGQRTGRNGTEYTSAKDVGRIIVGTPKPKGKPKAAPSAAVAAFLKLGS